MAQGIFLETGRPKTKTAIKKAVAAGEEVFIEATSWLGNEYSGPATGLPEGQTVYFVGPDPETKRSFYGQIKVVGGKVKVS